MRERRRIVGAAVREGKYVLTIHAEEEMANNGLSLDDVENGILTGVVQKRQKDLVTGGCHRLVGRVPSEIPMNSRGTVRRTE